ALLVQSPHHAQRSVTTRSPYFVFFSCFGGHRVLHSFPTRRSSDLRGPRRSPGACPRAQRAQVRAPRCQSAWRSRRCPRAPSRRADRKSTRLNSSHVKISYAVFCLKKKHTQQRRQRNKHHRDPPPSP